MGLSVCQKVPTSARHGNRALELLYSLRLEEVWVHIRVQRGMRVAASTSWAAIA